jgi:hypothetical protein
MVVLVMTFPHDSTDRSCFLLTLLVLVHSNQNVLEGHQHPRVTHPGQCIEYQYMSMIHRDNT